MKPGRSAPWTADRDTRPRPVPALTAVAGTGSPAPPGSQERVLEVTSWPYWDWTWADMGLYDDTANIRKMKEITGAEKVFYIGYSQGTI